MMNDDDESAAGPQRERCKRYSATTIITITLLLLLYTTRTKTHAQNTRNKHSSSRREQRLSLFRWDDETMVRTSRRARTRPSLSLSNVLSFFLQLNKPQKKFISLFLSSRRVIYTHALREEKKKTQAFVLRYKTRLLLFLLRVLFFTIWPPFESEREGGRGRHFKAEFGNCNFL